ncbi:hypothetical protein, partial [Mesorhizobium sp. M1406]|uniref:hypothetical protein n=1 Tax=Mesorhizobium sp. M1406 TaxID=2957099 RepID=UPI00333C257E
SGRMAIQPEAQSLPSHKIIPVQIQGVFQLGKDGNPSNTPQPSRRCAPIHLLPQGEKEER